jgi:hypothetical protein
VVGVGTRKNVKSREIVRSWGGGMTGETWRDVKQVENGVFDLPCIIEARADSGVVESMRPCALFKASLSTSV